MTRVEIREMWRAGNSTTDCLREVVASGFEYPDAVWKVTQALNLDAESVEEMELNYLEGI